MPESIDNTQPKSLRKYIIAFLTGLVLVIIFIPLQNIFDKQQYDTVNQSVQGRPIVILMEIDMAAATILTLWGLKKILFSKPRSMFALVGFGILYTLICIGFLFGLVAAFSPGPHAF